MIVYVVYKDKDIPNPYDLPNNEYLLVDCVRATEDAARQRLCELAMSGYRNCDYKEYVVR